QPGVSVASAGPDQRRVTGGLRTDRTLHQCSQHDRCRTHPLPRSRRRYRGGDRNAGHPGSGRAAVHGSGTVRRVLPARTRSGRDRAAARARAAVAGPRNNDHVCHDGTTLAGKEPRTHDSRVRAGARLVPGDTPAPHRRWSADERPRSPRPPVESPRRRVPGRAPVQSLHSDGRIGLLRAPSDYEGQPMVILEALTLRLPVITVNFGSAASALPTGGGQLVPQSDEGLAAGMQEYLDNQPSAPEFDPEQYNAAALAEFRL